MAAVECKVTYSLGIYRGAAENHAKPQTGQTVFRAEV